MSSLTGMPWRKRLRPQSSYPARTASSGADPVAEVAVEGADARLDLLARHLAEGRRSRVGEEILQGFVRQAVRVVLDQLDQSVGEHGRGSSCASPALMTPHPRSPALPSGWPSGALRP